MNEGKLEDSVIYPTGGKEAVEIVSKILAGEKFEKDNLIPVTLIDQNNADELYDRGF